LRPRRERRRIAWIEIENELNKLVKLVEEAKPLGSIPPGRNWRVWQIEPDINALKRDEYRRTLPSDLRGKLNEVCEIIGVYWKFGICAEMFMERIIEDAVHEKLPKTEEEARRTGVEAIIEGHRCPLRSFKEKLMMLGLPCHLMEYVIKGKTAMEYFKNMSPDIRGQLEIDLYEGESLELFFNYIDERLKSSLDPTIEFMKEYKMEFLNTLKLIKENYKRLNKQFT
jgi:hypothetical protein